MTLRVHAAGFIPVSRRFHSLARVLGDPFRLGDALAATVAEAGSVALSQRQEKPMTGAPDSPTGLSFERDIRPRNGTMPCDGAWPPEHVAVFQHWIAGGSAP